MNSSSKPKTSPTPAGSSGPELPLPSINRLVNATGIALAIACVLLVFVVFPAEYNIDPTGFGKATGLTRLSTPAPGSEDAPGIIPEIIPAPGSLSGLDPNHAAGESRNDSVVIEIPAGRGLEYKFSLLAGQKMAYNWTIQESNDPNAPGPETLIHDFHGEPHGAAQGVFESYSVSNAKGAKGTFTAPFDGVHGWYWNNTSKSTAKVLLTTSGTYEVLGLR